MIDTHCHLTYDGLYERVDQVITGATSAGVDRLITVGTTPPDCYKALDLSHQYPNVFATVGVHPHYAAGVHPDDMRVAYRELAEDPRVVALGEMGLDQHYPDPSLADQQRVLNLQLEICAPLNKPIIIHNREATDLTIAQLSASGIDPARFVFHCFTGEADELEAILTFGAMVSLTGIVTFSSARNLAEASDMIPLDRLMMETDSPYLTPAPHRKVRPNEPKYVIHTAEFISERRGLSFDEFVKQMDANAERFFKLPQQ